jgi:hypothetical protein
VGTERVAVRKGVGATGVVEKSKVGRDATVESTVTSVMGVLVTAKVSGEISEPEGVNAGSPTGEVGAQADSANTEIIIKEKKVLFKCTLS